jgi:4a-hydroxytetrahydrobiopterin dehydratase
LIVAWQEVDGKLVSVVRRKNFAEAMVLVNRVAAVAEAANHHPDIAIHWNEVTLTLWTHTAGAITDADRALATQLDAVMDTTDLPT